MSIKLGIRTPYSHCEATYAAMRIVDWADQRGIDVSILTTTDNLPTIRPDWDERILRPHVAPFIDWAAEQDVIVWMYPPAHEQLLWVKKMKKHTIGVLLWHMIRPGHRKLYSLFDTIVAPTFAAAELFRIRWELTNVFEAPWEPNLPATVKDPSRPERLLRVLVPLLDRMPDRTGPEALELIARLVAAQTAMISVAYSPAGLRSGGVRYLQQLAKANPDHCRLVRAPSMNNRPFMFHHHELTVWPTHSEDIGLLGMTSLAMGTPVAAFDVPPMNEFMMRENSLLYPCNILYTAAGAPVANPDYAGFGTEVLKLILDRDRRHQLERGASLNLGTRRATFNAQWDAITEMRIC